MISGQRNSQSTYLVKRRYIRQPNGRGTRGIIGLTTIEPTSTLELGPAVQIQFVEDLAQAAVEDRDHLVDLLVRDDQGRAERDPVRVEPTKSP